MLSGGEVAGLIVAVFWAVLVCFLASVLIKIGRVLKEIATLVIDVTERVVPLLGEVTQTVTSTNEQLARVDTITANVASITGKVTALSSVFASTLGGPLAKVAAFSYGVRRAVAKRRGHEMAQRVRAAMKAEKQASFRGREQQRKA